MGGLAPTNSLYTTRLSTELPSMGTPGLRGVSEHVHSNPVSGSQGTSSACRRDYSEAGQHSDPEPWSLPSNAAAASLPFEGPRGNILPHQWEDCRQCKPPEVSRPQSPLQSPCFLFLFLFVFSVLIFRDRGR